MTRPGLSKPAYLGYNDGMQIPWLVTLSIIFCLTVPAAHATGGLTPSDILKLATHGRTPVQAVFFNSQDTALCIADEGPGKPAYGSLRTAMERLGCKAGVNGGYFSADAARTPLGLLRHAGKSVTPLSTNGFTVSGVLYDTGKDIRLERSKSLSFPVERMQEAIQGGPFLVERGKPVAGLNNVKSARRTFVATDGAGNWCLAVTSPVTLHELADTLAKQGVSGKLKVQTALNLDGGSSSALWEETSGRRMSNLKPVRNYVGIMPRRTGAPTTRVKNKR